MTQDASATLKELKLICKFAAAAAFAVSLASLYVSSSMDNGGYFDAHKSIPKILAQAGDFPETRKAILEGDLHDMADQREQDMRETAAGASLALTLTAFYYHRKLQKTLAENTPR